MKHYYLTFCMLLITGSLLAQEANSTKLNVNKGSVNIATEDGQFKFGVGGRVYMDAAGYFDDKTDLGSGSEIRDIRMLFKASVWKKWDAKINIGFANGAVSLKDVWLMYHIDKNSFVRAGHFLEPFGIEQTESSKTSKFMNVASTIEAFRPGRNLGVSYDRWGKNYYWALGLFGSDVNNSVKNQDEDFSITSRIAISPFHTENIMHFGLSGSYRSVNVITNFENKFYTSTERGSVRYSSRAATHIEGRRFIDATIENAESEFKFGIEMIAASGPVSFQSELIRSKVNVEKDYSYYKDYKADGWYMQFGFLLKGGNYKYKMKSARLAKPVPGSLELLARYNETDLNDTNALIWGGKQTDLTLGCTWYVNHNVLMKLNFTNVDLDENALNGEENFNMIQTRLQFSF